MGVIYMTENLHNKSKGIDPWRYIGSDKNNDPSYLGSSADLKRDINDLGRQHFVKTILLDCGEVDATTLRWIEAKQFLKPNNVKKDPSYYNKSDWYAPGGGVKGMKHTVERSAEHRKKIVEHRTGSTKSIESRQLMRQRKLGRKLTEEHRQKISQPGERNPNALEWTVTAPDGTKYHVKALKKWARDNNVPYFDLYDSKHGWQAIKHGTGKGGRGRRKTEQGSST